MSDATFFSDKLVQISLPRLKPGAAAVMPALKRLALSQGELAQFHDSETPIHYIAALELVPGSVRGNHYHRIKVEHVYVIRGELELIAQELESGDQAGLVMRAGDLTVIQPGVAHAFQVRHEGVAIEFAPTRFDPSDIHRHALV